MLYLFFNLKKVHYEYYKRSFFFTIDCYVLSLILKMINIEHIT